MKRTEIERRNALANNTETANKKYFNLQMPVDLPVGTTFTITITEDGQIACVPNGNKENCSLMPVTTATGYEAVIDEIQKGGYVNNNHLYRRFVMAQTFRMMNYKGYGWREDGYNAALRNFSYEYQFKTVLDELNVLKHMEADCDSELKMREIFYGTSGVCSELMRDYIYKVGKEIENEKVRHCKGRGYKRLRGYGDVYLTDLSTKVFNPLNKEFDVMKALEKETTCDKYKRMYECMERFVRAKRMRFANRCSLCNMWKETFKGVGGYYTLQNMIRFHGVDLHMEEREYHGWRYDVTEHVFSGKEAENMLDDFAKKVCAAREPWKLFCVLEHTLEETEYDFYEDMKEQYSK